MSVFRRKQSKTLIILAALAISLVTGASAFGGVFDSDDSTNTIRDYRLTANVTFLGNTLKIASPTSSDEDYTLINTTGQANSIVESFSSKTLDVSDIPQGRYKVNNTTSHTNTVNIDVVRNNSNTTGRIQAPSNITSTPEIDLYYWLNGTEMPSGAYEKDVVNLTNMNSPFFNDERIYRLNTTDPQLDKYWITVNTSGFGLDYSSSRAVQNPLTGLPTVNKPRINDFSLENEYFVQGTVYNLSVDKTPGDNDTSGVEVRLRGIDPNYQSRMPYMNSPPVMTNITDSGGMFNFTGLAPGDYQLEIMNNSATNDTYNSFKDSFRIRSPPLGNGSVTGHDLYFTSHTGDISGDIEGSSPNESVRYAVGVFNESKSRTFMEPGVDPNSFTLEGIPNGTYQVMAARFEVFNGQPDFELASKSNVTVSNGATNQIGTLRFPETVKFNATVYNSSTEPKKDIGDNAVVVLENRSEASSGQSQTGTDGTFSMNLANNTLHQVSIIPDPESDYKRTETDVNVNGTTRLNYNLSVNTGTTVDGYVKENGVGKDAEVLMYNRTERSFGRATTDNSGYYSISGLKEDTNYTVDVYTREPGLGNNLSFQLETVASGETKEQNFTFTEQKIDLGGNITDSSNANIEGEVVVDNPVENIKKRDSFNKSQFYNITDLPSGTFYRVRVVPDDSSYESREEFFRLEDNRTEDFQLSGLKEFTATVEDIGDNSVKIEDVRVVAQNSNGDSFDSGVTDSNGEVALNLKKESHDFFLIPDEDSSYSPNKTSVNVDNTKTWSFELSSSSFLQGNITRKSTGEKTSESGTIRVWNKTEEVFREKKFSGGGYNVTGLRSSIGYNVWVKSDNRTFQINRTEAASNDLAGTFNVSLKLNNGRSLRVKVQDGNSSEGLDDATVNVRGLTNDTDSSGEALFSRQPEGETIDIAAQKDGYLTTSKQVKVKSRDVSFGTKEYQDVEIELNESRDVNIDFNVTDSNGAVSGAVVQVRSNRTDTAAQASSGVTDSSGEALVEDVIPGNSDGYGGGYIVNMAPGEDTVYMNETFLAENSTGKIETAEGDYTVMYEVPE